MIKKMYILGYDITEDRKLFYLKISNKSYIYTVSKSLQGLLLYTLENFTEDLPEGIVLGLSRHNVLSKSLILNRFQEELECLYTILVYDDIFIIKSGNPTYYFHNLYVGNCKYKLKLEVE